MPFPLSANRWQNLRIILALLRVAAETGKYPQECAGKLARNAQERR